MYENNGKAENVMTEFDEHSTNKMSFVSMKNGTKYKDVQFDDHFLYVDESLIVPIDFMLYMYYDHGVKRNKHKVLNKTVTFNFYDMYNVISSVTLTLVVYEMKMIDDNMLRVETLNGLIYYIVKKNIALIEVK